MENRRQIKNNIEKYEILHKGIRKKNVIKPKRSGLRISEET